jgi:hypothetical protein
MNKEEKLQAAAEKRYIELKQPITISKKFINDFAIDLTTSEAAREYWKELFEQESKQNAIEFETWLTDEGWIRDPFPRKDFEDCELRYTNIATIDEEVNEKLSCLTITELYDIFINNKQSKG